MIPDRYRRLSRSEKRSGTISCGVTSNTSRPTRDSRSHLLRCQNSSTTDSVTAARASATQSGVSRRSCLR